MSSSLFCVLALHIRLPECSRSSTTWSCSHPAISCSALWHEKFDTCAGEWWDPCDRERWVTSKRMLRAPHPEEGEQPDADQGWLLSNDVVNKMSPCCSDCLCSQQTCPCMKESWLTRTAAATVQQVVANTMCVCVSKGY